MTTINLLPAQRLQTIRLTRRIRRWSGLIAAYATLAAGVCLSVANSNLRAATELLAEADHVERQVADTESRYKQLTLEVAQALRRLDAARSVSRRPDWSVLLTLISSIRGDHVALDSLEIAPLATPDPAAKPGSPAPKKTRVAADACEIKLVGFASAQPVVSDFVLALEGTHVFDEVTLVETKARPDPAVHGVEFRIHCTIGAPHAPEHRP